MSTQTYTPTHCPETGRKFTKAERKAANKAKYAAERAAQASAPKPEGKRKRKAKAQKVKPTPASVSVPGRTALMRMTKAQLVEIIVGSEATASEPAPERAPKRKSKRKPTQAVRKPKRKSADGLEQAQARKNTAERVGAVTTRKKVVHAVTGGDAHPFEPRMEVEVPVQERKVRKLEQMRVTLLPGESPQDAIRRMKIQAEQAQAEACALEAEQLMLNF